MKLLRPHQSHLSNLNAAGQLIAIPRIEPGLSVMPRLYIYVVEWLGRLADIKIPQKTWIKCGVETGSTGVKG